MRNFINHLFRKGPQVPHQCPRVQLTSQLGTTRARIGVNFILESGINEVEDIWQWDEFQRNVSGIFICDEMYSSALFTPGISEGFDIGVREDFIFDAMVDEGGSCGVSLFTTPIVLCDRMSTKVGSWKIPGPSFWNLVDVIDISKKVSNSEMGHLSLAASISSRPRGVKISSMTGFSCFP